LKNKRILQEELMLLIIEKPNRKWALLMNEAKNALRLMRALERLFIGVRAFPEYDYNANVTKIFNDNLNEGMIFDNKTILTIKEQLKNPQDFHLRPVIITELNKCFIKYDSFDLEYVRISIGALKHALNELQIKLENHEYDKARAMASALHNYPSFLLNKFYAAPKEFWEQHICFYQRVWNEGFMSEYEVLIRRE
jgi:hypothetical protein